MSNKDNSAAIPDAPPIRQAQGGPSDGESPASLMTRTASGKQEVGEVPEFNSTPSQEQLGVNATGESPTNVITAVPSEQTKSQLAAASTTQRRAAVAAEPVTGEQATAALQAAQQEQAQSAIVPSGLDLNRPISKAVVVDTGSKTGNGLNTSTLREINGIGTQRASGNVAAAEGTTGAGNIVRQNPRLVAANAAKEAAKAENAKLKEDLEALLAAVPASNRSDIIRLEQYCVAMAPGRPLSDTQGAAEQVALFRLLQNVINRQSTYFVPLFTAVLRIFRTHSVNGALSDAYRNRFGHHIPLSAQERKALQKLTHLLCVMADPKTRGMASKIIDIESALEDGLTEEGRNRVISFFG